MNFFLYQDNSKYNESYYGKKESAYMITAYRVSKWIQISIKNIKIPNGFLPFIDIFKDLSPITSLHYAAYSMQYVLYSILYAALVEYTSSNHRNGIWKGHLIK